MYIIKEQEELKDAEFWIELATKEAKNSTCHRSKCGSVIVAYNKALNNSLLIGRGYNSMPCNVTGDCFKGNLDPSFKSDKTCCVHAEQRAIIQALKDFPNLIKHSRLFFIRLDDEGNPKRSGKPYCTI